MISIITPSYQQLDWLRLAVTSVSDQQNVELEHIVQDAGTEGILTWAEANFGRLLAKQNLKIYCEKDEGMYDAINRGLARSTGEICAYLNCDEQYLPGALATVLNFFKANPNVEVIFGDVVLIDRHGTPLSYRRTVLPTRRHLQLAHLNTSTCATFFRRQLLDRGFYFDPQWRAIGDMVWIDSMLAAGVQMRTLSAPLATFTFTGRNLGATSSSVDEAAQWQSGRSGRRPRAQRALAVVQHRLRKALHGAYRRRNLEIAIYTLDSPNCRVSKRNERTGYKWPRL